jgi:hypothetical protein
MKEKQRNHSKHYYEYDRNLDNALKMNEVEDKRIPEYYKGKEGYEARKVCDNFDLTYHIGTAVTYLLRAYHKHDTPVDCIKKAIAHLEFELEKLQENS